MLKKDPNSEEIFIHICPDSYKYRKEALKQRITIYKHDISNFFYRYDENGKLTVEHIDYCPYCGMKLDNDNEYI